MQPVRRRALHEDLPDVGTLRAENGVVDFQDDDCIGCKSCMNACPYDALYINPETNTAHKCNMCNHRKSRWNSSRRVRSCARPRRSRSATSTIRTPRSRQSSPATTSPAVRAPEQNTKPKVYYKGADQASLDPTRTAIANDGMIWADTDHRAPTRRTTRRSRSRSVRSRPFLHGVVARTAYTTDHHMMTWKEKVSGYLLTKGISAGLVIARGHRSSSCSMPRR